MKQHSRAVAVSASSSVPDEAFFGDSYIERIALRILPPELWSQLQAICELPAVDFDEKPIDTDSLRNFLNFWIGWGGNSVPTLSLTPNGILEADWRRETTHRLTMRFLPGGLVIAVLVEPEGVVSAEITVPGLLAPSGPFRMPDWA